MTRLPISIQVLVENTANHKGLLGEHGLAYSIRAGEKHILFDTGQGMALPLNAAALHVDIQSLDGIALSHGHYDHTGGLRVFAARDRIPPIYAHPTVWETKYAKNKAGTIYPVGLSVMEGLPVSRFQERAVSTVGPTEIAPGLWATGQIPRITDFEPPSVQFYLDEAGNIPDEVLDDQALFYNAPQGIVVLLGCAHAGVINTLRYIQELAGNRPFYHVMGGMHLLHAPSVRLEKTRDALREMHIQSLSPCHCTGRTAVLMLYQTFGERCVEICTGSQFSA